VEDFLISVVIPFYNAREFVTQAVESALAQPETGEVLLIEDGSPDGGLDVCQTLAQKYPKVRLLRHPDGGNHGEPASRNLGIINSKFSYIAFLDADDYFLPNRFKRTTEVFQTLNNVDGVYEAIGVTFQNQSDKEFWSHLPFKDITTVTKVIEPENLFEELISGRNGYFSVDGFTVRKDLLKRIGYFNNELRYMSDTDCILKLSAKGKLYPGNIQEPVSIRRVHDKNRITYHFLKKREIYHSSLILWEPFLKWGRKNLSTKREMLVIFHLLDRIRKSDYFDDFQWFDFFASRKKMFKLAFEFPTLLIKLLFWRMLLPSSKCFGTHRSMIS
jgi:glycosyltransferase involved in cell wall biosynthesis